jgi:hypothetical protein
VRYQFPDLDVTDHGGDWLEDMAIDRDGADGPAI